MSDDLNADTLEKLKVAELKEHLLKRKLSTTGNKSVLVERLRDALGSGDKVQADDESADDEESEEKEKPNKKRKKSKGAKESDSKKQKTESVTETDFSKPPLGKDELKIVTWNVASLKAIMDKGFVDYLKQETPDIICLNETKVSETAFEGKFESSGYPHCYFYSAKKPGYSGTAIFSKTKPVGVTKGIGIETHDDEGRVITAEYNDFYLVATYIPNAGAKGEDKMPKDLQYRGEWDSDFLKYLVKLKEKKSVIWCGDLNVAHKPVDLKNPKTNTKTAGFTQQERDNFQKVLDSGFIDSYRAKYPDTVSYTFWSYKQNARAKNVGWRLDYFVTSKDLVDRIVDVYPRTYVMGSDHCPLVLHLKKKTTSE